MNRVKQTIIDGRDVQIYLLRASQGIAMAQKLGGLAATFFDQGSEGEIDINFAKIFKGISEELKYEELDKMIKALLHDMAIDGKAIDFELEFAGNYGFFVKIMAYALQENFGSFFEGLDILGE